MSARSGPFRPATVAGMLLLGGAAFLLLLYALGAGWTGQENRDGGTHAASNSLNGYAGLVNLLERRGHDVSLSRTPSRLQERALLVVTPGMYSDAGQLQDLINDRKDQGPTLLILPKWSVFPVPGNAGIEAEDGWVILGGAMTPEWLAQMPAFEGVELEIGTTQGWSGLGLEGALPEGDHVQAITRQPSPILFPIVTDAEGDLLAGYWNQNGYFPDLAADSGVEFSREDEKQQDDAIWPLVVVIEPDLLNNYGLADMARAQQAVLLVEASMDGVDLPIIFDMTIPGLGSSMNLLTLAFRPPFLAATLCLLLAALVIGWRGFRRFGPPNAPAPAIARGKRQLARNSAALIERTRRWHLLGAPYADMIAARIAAAFQIRERDPALRAAAIDRALAARDEGAPHFSETAEALRNAHGQAEILRAAAALTAIENRMIR
ncbi:hypothetical protein GCM10009127_06910 [Alteraurantiacibacter aestuarii]|uniref:DUF4350 domain-containing protein n=1 Tax=Alteraurantiacibacter aestuarii TaxID=650004 RepID=A0A844ZN28_9SPHN|nr:DUF4350 domain-containing protein [Alteraurantiacibacter aestuarii]MXO89168.1 DUF4350 domain-containing protein [Alteraurantiacibacter aestuarii]